jgi:hypothetical protein
MLDILRLRVLAAIAAQGSVTKAAKHLNYSQPAVSHHLAKLEAETGVGEDAAGPGDELPEPGRGPSVEAAECALDDVASFDPPVGADRGGGEVCCTQVGGVIVQWRAVLAE